MGRAGERDLAGAALEVGDLPVEAAAAQGQALGRNALRVELAPAGPFEPRDARHAALQLQLVALFGVTRPAPLRMADHDAALKAIVPRAAGGTRVA
jgi:hypothetical protein